MKKKYSKVLACTSALMLSVSLYAENPRPNVVFIICDDLNDYMGVFGGHPQIKTPHIDELAESGIAFVNAHSNTPVCVPSRNSLFTGVYSHDSKDFGWTRLSDQPVLKHNKTMMELFTENGYHVMGSGKLLHHHQSGLWHEWGIDNTWGVGISNYGPIVYNGIEPVGHPSVPEPFRSIGPIDGTFAPLSDVPRFPDSISQGNKTGWLYMQGTDHFLEYTDENNRDLMPDEMHAQWAAKRIKEMEAEDFAQPFFMGVGFVRPHTPLIAPKRFFDMFPLDEIVLSEIKENDAADTHYKDIYPSNTKGLRYYRTLKESYDGDIELGLKHFLQAYLACVAFVDEQIGVVVDAINNSKFKDNTIIVLTSDHGWQMGEKEFLFKNSPWEESTRVPLIIRPANSSNGGLVNHPVSLIDVFPTLIELCELEGSYRKNNSGGRMGGFSLRPFIENPTTTEWEGPNGALSMIGNGLDKEEVLKQTYSYRSKDWRYIIYLNGKEELYHNKTDPFEWYNLANDEQYYPIKDNLRAEMMDIILNNRSFLSSEAEDGITKGSAEIRAGCQHASGEKFVVLGNTSGNSLLFDDIEMSVAGAYQLTIDYFYVKESKLEIVVNNISLGIFSFESANWCYQGPPQQKTIDIDMVLGANKVEFRAVGGQVSPFLDKITIISHGAIQLSLTASKNVVFPGEQVTLIIEASQPPEDNVELTFEVIGRDKNAYRISPETVTIPADSGSAFAIFEVLESEIFVNYPFTINIICDQQDVVLGASATVKMTFVNQRTNYYVSSSEGDDMNDGKSKENPWKSIEKVSQANLLPGDTIFFKRGDTFYGQLVVNRSGRKNSPLVFSSYGEGEKPVIDGAKDQAGAYLSAVYINNQEHIEMYHLELTNDRIDSRQGVSDNLAYGIYVLNNGDEIMQHFVFNNLTIRDVFAPTIEGVDFNAIRVSGIGIYSESNTIAGKEKNIRDVLVEDCYFNRIQRFGIHTGHSGSAEGIGNDSINRNMNLVFRNNYFYHTGGSGITPGRSYNVLLENNIFDYPGSDIDPRMVKRGSGAWFWNCHNVFAQYNHSYHVRGKGDSYGMHIDFGNRNVFFQYNFSEDSEGGFLEILGDNKNSTWRHNISVNDGFRATGHNRHSIWLSGYVGSGRPPVPSDNNFIYNNTIYLDDAKVKPGISIFAKNTYIYNNIFYAINGAGIGTGTGSLGVTIDMAPDAELLISNNLFFGNIANSFVNLDNNRVVGDPQFENPYATDKWGRSSDGFKLKLNSHAIDAGKFFTEPTFPMAGQGIFKNISLHTATDFFGNPLDINNLTPNIGADNSHNSESIVGINHIKAKDDLLRIYPNPVNNKISINLSEGVNGQVDIQILDMQGKIMQTYSTNINPKELLISFLIDSSLRNGIYFLVVKSDYFIESRRFVLVRST